MKLTATFPAMIALAFAMACKGPSEPSENLPNIVIFLVDDLGWTDLGCYGSEYYQTPHVDRLAEEGVRFTDAYAACTVCSPTRASILTGKYPARLHTTDWIAGHLRPYAEYRVPDWKMYLDSAETTLAEVLADQGYRTAHIGKWHLGENEENWPENHGFDINLGGWKKGAPNQQQGKGGYFSPYFNPRLQDGPEGEYLTERLATEARTFIQENKDAAFFLNFWLYNVHTPLQAKPDRILRFEERVDSTRLQANPTYAAMVSHMDDALGVVVDALQEAGVYENTIIVFTSDNGGLTGDRNRPGVKPRVTSNAPLRSGKGDMYEGGVRVPLIFSWPGSISGGRTTKALSISADLYPTLLSMAGLAAVTDSIDGKDLSQALLGGNPSATDEIFWHYPHYHTEGATPYSAIRQGDWKLVWQYSGQNVELYDLSRDIGERDNLAESEPERAARLLARLNQWKKEVGAQEPTPNPDYDREREGNWGGQYHH